MIPMRAEVTIDGGTEIYIADAASKIRPSDVRAEIPNRNITDFGARRPLRLDGTGDMVRSSSF